MGCNTQLIGQVFDKLTVVAYSHSDKSHFWICQCVCGNTRTVATGNLRNGNAKSCGKCDDQRVTHGLSDHPLYMVWKNMKARCYHPNNKEYHNYGGRGIIVSDDWLIFDNFYLDNINDYDLFIQNNPNKTPSIERVDVDGNYEKGNCIWIEYFKQGHNKRCNKLDLNIANNIRSLYATGKYSTNQLAKMFNVSATAIKNILNNKTWKP